MSPNDGRNPYFPQTLYFYSRSAASLLRLFPFVRLAIVISRPRKNCTLPTNFANRATDSADGVVVVVGRSVSVDKSRIDHVLPR